MHCSLAASYISKERNNGGTLTITKVTPCIDETLSQLLPELLDLLVPQILNHWIPLLKVQLKALIRWPQTIIGPTEPPYSLLPNPKWQQNFFERPSNQGREVQLSKCSITYFTKIALCYPPLSCI